MPAPNWGSLFGLYQNSKEKTEKGQTFSIWDLMLLDTHVLAPLKESWIHCWYCFFTLRRKWLVLISRVLFWGVRYPRNRKMKFKLWLSGKRLEKLREQTSGTWGNHAQNQRNQFSNQLRIFTFMIWAICVIVNHILLVVVLTNVISRIQRSLRS